jgi:hypothetical protein
MSIRVPVATSSAQILLGWHDSSTPFSGSGLAINIGTTGHYQYWEGTAWNDCSAAINDNAWHQIVVTHTGAGGAGQVALYIDGALINNPSGPSAVAGYTGVRGIGANSDGSNTANGVDIEWVGVWTRVLSSGDVTSFNTDPFQFVNSGAPAVTMPTGAGVGI